MAVEVHEANDFRFVCLFLPFFFFFWSHIDLISFQFALTKWQSLRTFSHNFNSFWLGGEECYYHVVVRFGQGWVGNEDKLEDVGFPRGFG